MPQLILTNAGLSENLTCLSFVLSYTPMLTTKFYNFIISGGLKFIARLAGILRLSMI
jgi:hypothetical protein